MKLRLYVENPLSDNCQIELGRESAHYLKNVMRRKVSDQIYLFNGQDGEWLAEILGMDNKTATVLLLENSREQKNPPDIWLIFAKIKRNPTEFLIQKATELGASKFIPVFTEYSESKASKTERLKHIAIEAAEQCERLTIPEIKEAMKLSELLNEWSEDRRIITCDESGGGTPINKVLSEQNSGEKWAILIGPEGGFSTSELETLKNLHYVTKVGLGPRILKAETAAIAALTCWESILGDWDESPDFKNKK